MDIKRILLVSYDCVRADVAYLPKMQGVANLARRGVRFDFALSSAPLTPVSHATVFTGRYPSGHGLRHLFREKISPTAPILARSMQRIGFKTAAIVSCPGLNRWYGFHRGFDHFDDWLPPLPSGEDAMSLKDVKYRGLALKRADQVVDRATQWLDQQSNDDKWFLFAHFFDSHWPYEPPKEYDNPANPYEGEVLYSDYHFRNLCEYLEKRDWIEGTLIILFGDHGEDLAGWYSNDKSGPEGMHPEEEGHGCLLYQQTQHVPLIFSHPELTENTISEPVGLIDIYPTISSLVGAPPPVNTDGIDLSKTLEGEPPPHRTLYAETFYPQELIENTGKFENIRNLQAVWLDRNKKIIWPHGFQDEALAYNLDTDPLENNPRPIAEVDWQIPLDSFRDN